MYDPTSPVLVGAECDPLRRTFGKVSTFPPTACGIATFAAALSAGLVALGATVDVPLPDGSVQMSVPAGSGQGRKLRLKGKGIPGKTPGDLYVVLQIAVPPPANDLQRQAWRELARLQPFNPRADLGAK